MPIFIVSTQVARPPQFCPKLQFIASYSLISEAVMVTVTETHQSDVAVAGVPVSMGRDRDEACVQPLIVKS
ncbi:hypothetical protein NQ315_014072 [Exocentrus adspersus]|uniref:Uncharacterized protein n=1 Tax=Exocentrus adspersus TaxID=1586481 RepID=A0AAV8VVL4_9CUCU|nr:hypothetical protein NQ315_014072 [Exocentrus adspersus]